MLDIGKKVWELKQTSESKVLETQIKKKDLDSMENCNKIKITGQILQMETVIAVIQHVLLRLMLGRKANCRERCF